MSPAPVSLIRRVRREKVVVWLVVGRGWEELPVRFEEGLGGVGGWVGEGGKGVGGLTGG
jgi:hypothetical protein